MNSLHILKQVNAHKSPSYTNSFLFPVPGNLFNFEIERNYHHKDYIRCLSILNN